VPLPNARHRICLLLLVTALVAVYWLANALERNSATEREGLTFTPPGGAYAHSQLLEFLPSRPHAPVVFTIDGTIPSATVGTLYERPLRLDSASPGVTVVRAREFTYGAPGPVLSASYIVGVAHTLPIVSIIADPADLWDPEHGILVNPWRRGQEWERPVHVTYIEGDHSAGFEIPAGLRIRGNDRELAGLPCGTAGSDLTRPSFGLYFRRDYGAARLEYPLFPEHQQDTQSYNRLLLQAGNKCGRWTLLGDQLLSEVATEMDRYAAQGRLVLFFLNGKPWGIYRLSERIDRFFLEDNLGILAADLIQDGRTVESDSQHWDGLMNWLQTHDLSIEEHYSHLQTQIDVDSLTDHAILQMYFGWSGGNLGAARPQVQGGRWFWLYGSDRQETEPAQNTESTLLGLFDSSSDLTLLLGKLLENPDYRARFAGRAADLLNTLLAPTPIKTIIDRLASQLRPDIGFETANRAVGSADPGFGALMPGDLEWERNVVALREFAQSRSDTVRQQMVAELELRSTVTITFSRSAQGGGYVVVNRTPISSLPWSGTYFLDTELHVMAVPEPGYVFAGWENCLHSACRDGSEATSTPSLTLAVDGPRAITAHFSPMHADDPRLRPNDVIINEYWINDNGTSYASVGDHAIEGDWFELSVTRPRTIDLRGWRITDNNSKIGTSEGSIILPALDALAAVPRGTAILIVATENNANEAQFRRDDLDSSDGQMVFYIGNGHLDVTTDPGFNIGTSDDNLVLLAPGRSPSFADDIGVDFVAEGDAVAPLSFGVMADGVTFDEPFRGLGNDDGAVFTQAGNNDHGDIGWIVDPTSRQSGDDSRPGATNILTPGQMNYEQDGLSLPASVWGLLLVALSGAVIARWLHGKRA
jgi:hypothetical protein